MIERVWGYLVSVTLLGAVFYPLQTTPRQDSFPLSSYPMFSKARPAIIEIDHVVGYGAGSERAVLPPEVVGSGEVLQTKASVTAAVKQGRRVALNLCHAVAERVAHEVDLAWVKGLEVRTDSFQVLGYFSGSRKPIRSAVHAKCTVRR